MNATGLIQKTGNALIVIKGIDDQCNVFAHINLGIPGASKKLGCSVNEVGRHNAGKEPLLISLIHQRKTVAEQAKCGKDEDSIGAARLQLTGNIDHGFTGGDHIVNHDDVHHLGIAAEILVGLNGSLAVDNHRVITALVEHTEF